MVFFAGFCGSTRWRLHLRVYKFGVQQGTNSRDSLHGGRAEVEFDFIRNLAIQIFLFKVMNSDFKIYCSFRGDNLTHD